jgi:DNA-binding response OmpR family regulator
MVAYRILIVEDQREVSHLLRTALETLEHELEVVEIPSGEEAILDASRNKVDLLVTDFRLAGITGIELMRKVRSHRPEAKVILITGLTDRKVRKEVAEAGADAFFLKPVPIADFLDAVERHLGLVETMLPAEPISEIEKVMAVRMSSHHEVFNAKAANIRVHLWLGELPNALVSDIVAPTVFSANPKAEPRPAAWR